MSVRYSPSHSPNTSSYSTDFVGITIVSTRIGKTSWAFVSAGPL